MSNTNTVTFCNITKEETLLKLWNSTKTIGLGYLHSHSEPSIKNAEEQLNRDNYVDYWFGRRIKTNFSTFPKLISNGYDRVAGKGTMKKVALDLATFIGKTNKILSKEDAEKIILISRNIDSRDGD